MTAVIIIVVISVIVLAAEALIIIPDKIPFVRKRVQKNDQSGRTDR